MGQQLKTLDYKTKKWFSERPLLLPYIALIVTLELLVLLVKF